MTYVLYGLMCLVAYIVIMLPIACAVGRKLAKVSENYQEVIEKE